MPKMKPWAPEWRNDRTVLLYCPAKINLALSVGSPRDDGMHPIVSWMVPIALSDTLTIRRALGAGDRSQFDISFAEHAPVRQPVDWPLESDLAYRAHGALEARVGRELPIQATLVKWIPAGAGLGGGSADAAGMLVGLNTLFGLQLDGAALMEIASGLGSDVMFQLRARLSESGAVVSGTGGHIEPLHPMPRTKMLLILPPFGCSTPAVYRAFDAALDTDEPRKPDADRVWRLAQQTPGPGTGLFNDLASPACDVQPDLRDVLDRAYVLGLTPHVTGSGSAVFCLLDPGVDEKAWGELVDRVEEATGCAVMAMLTVG